MNMTMKSLTTPLAEQFSHWNELQQQICQKFEGIDYGL